MFVTKIYDMINLMYLFGIINISNFFIYLVTRVGRGSRTPHAAFAIGVVSERNQRWCPGFAPTVFTSCNSAASAGVT